jgi:hypothetical protein
VSGIRFKEMEPGLQQAKSPVAVSRKSLDDCKLYAPRDIEAGAGAIPGWDNKRPPSSTGRRDSLTAR